VGEASMQAYEESKLDDYSLADENAMGKDGTSPDQTRFGRDKIKENEDESPFIDHFYSIDSGHKDFVRSMIQTNNDHTIITASEDKTIKIFTISIGNNATAVNI
jgi:hypothetical protein